VADNVTQAKPDTDTHKQRLRRIRSNMRRRVDLKRCEEVRKEKPTTPDPFNPVPVFHFVAHLWPKPDRWQWHVEHWNRVAESINGRAIVYVATDPSTDEFETVTAMLSPKFEAVHVRNTAAGESPSFRDALKRIPSGPDDVLLYAHGKGMQDHTFTSPAVRLWTELMYETVIHNRGRIEQKLCEGYRSFGSFRAFGRAPLSPKHRWHYAGTFFAIRMKHVTSFHVKQQYGGVEAWPGDQFPPEFAWVEFADCRDIMSHYSEQSLRSSNLSQSLNHWRQKRNAQIESQTLVAITTCNLDGRRELFIDFTRTIESLRRHFAGQVLVIDDGSVSAYSEWLVAECRKHDATVERLPVNSGVAVAKNTCIRRFLESDKQTLIMLDDDIEILSRDFVWRYVAGLQSVPVLSFNDPEFTKTTPELRHGIRVTDHTCGICIALPRDVALQHPELPLLPGKWGLAHTTWCANIAGKHEFYDIAGSESLLRIASHESVFSHAQKLACEETNRTFLREG
jgi:hypothetical protein